MEADTLPQRDGGEPVPGRRQDPAPAPAISTTVPPPEIPTPRLDDKDEE